MVKMVSIDSSTNQTGMALFEDGKYSTHTLLDCHLYRDTDERINTMIKGIITTLQEWKPDIVWIEQPKGQMNVEMTRKLSEILGAVRMWCVWRDREYHEIMPSVWRKYLPGFDQGKKKRSELKQQAIDYVKDKLDIVADTDSADSICIGLSVLEYCSDLN